MTPSDDAAKSPIGFGTIGSLQPSHLGRLAARCEELGYAHFWMNIIPGTSKPIEMLDAALGVTTRIDVGIGVVPVDSYPPEDLAASLVNANLPIGRVILGLGCGYLRTGAARAVRDGINVFRDQSPGTRIGVGGYGPLILQTAGRLADALCLAWMTTERLEWAQDQARAGAKEAGRRLPPIYLYVRCAVGADAEVRLLREMEEYGRQPHHQRHQAALASPGPVGVAVRTRGEIGQSLEGFGDAQVVVRGLPRRAEDINEWIDLAEFFAPANDAHR